MIAKTHPPPATSTIAPVSCVVGAMRSGTTSGSCSLARYRIFAYTALLDRLDGSCRRDAARLFFAHVAATWQRRAIFSNDATSRIIDEVAGRCFRGGACSRIARETR